MGVLGNSHLVSSGAKAELSMRPRISFYQRHSDEPGQVILDKSIDTGEAPLAAAALEYVPVNSSSCWVSYSA